MSRAYDIVTIGDLSVDVMVNGRDVTPEFGQVEKLVDDYTVEMGGSCSIFACQAAKLGLRIGILGRVGDDDFGRLILRRLQESGVDTRHVTVDPALKTGMGVALCREHDRAILTYLGSIAAVRPADVTDGFLASARHLHYGSVFLHTQLLPHVLSIVQRARALGTSVSFDTNWDPAGRWDLPLGELLPLVDVLMPNEQEATRLSGRADVAQSVAWLQAHGVPMVTLKRGAEGADLYAGAEHFTCASAPVTGGDSVGAGDSFDAGFLAGWLRGLPPDACLRIACACGRGVASRVGGVAGQLSWDEAIRARPFDLE